MRCGPAQRPKRSQLQGAASSSSSRRRRRTKEEAKAGAAVLLLWPRAYLGRYRQVLRVLQRRQLGPGSQAGIEQ